MSRRQRQIDELRQLCCAGAVAHAIDLAFEHFARFGRDDDVVALLSGALEHAEVSDAVRRRWSELRTAAA